MTEFNREHRYWVFKRKHLTDNEDKALAKMAEVIPKATPNSVVIEHDWPMYEQAWRDVKAFSKGDPTQLEQLRKANSKLVDTLDLMRDEFNRIKVLSKDSEIDGLCDRAVLDIEQNVPVIVRCEQLEKDRRTDNRMIHDGIVVRQAAWIEWQKGKGADAAMEWIHNSLWGPGLIPDDDEKWSDNAQFYYSANISNPLPECPCGNPSSIGAGGGVGYCSWFCHGKYHNRGSA